MALKADPYLPQSPRVPTTLAAAEDIIALFRSAISNCFFSAAALAWLAKSKDVALAKVNRDDMVGI